MNAGISSAGCWPSESIVSAWREAGRLRRLAGRAAPRRPCRRCAAAASTVQAGVGRGQSAQAGSPVPSVLPSTTTQTGFHCARAARTVR